MDFSWIACIVLVFLLNGGECFALPLPLQVGVPQVIQFRVDEFGVVSRHENFGHSMLRMERGGEAFSSMEKRALDICKIIPAEP